MRRAELEHVIRAAAAINLAAGRPKDWLFVSAMLANDLVNPQTVQERLMQTALPNTQRQRLVNWVNHNQK
jgi:hypothetical protein